VLAQGNGSISVKCKVPPGLRALLTLCTMPRRSDVVQSAGKDSEYAASNSCGGMGNVDDEMVATDSGCTLGTASCGNGESEKWQIRLFGFKAARYNAVAAEALAAALSN